MGRKDPPGTHNTTRDHRSAGVSVTHPNGAAQPIVPLSGPQVLPPVPVRRREVHPLRMRLARFLRVMLTPWPGGSGARQAECAGLANWKGRDMESERSDETGLGGGLSGSLLGLVSWRATFILGLITLILGVILAFRPAASLAVIAVLVGVVMIVCGIYHIVRALDGHEHQRVWRGIAGVLFILTGLILLRHLHLSVALIGLIIGLTWIVQGLSSIVEAFSGPRGRGGRGWPIIFGIISLIAGTILVVAPIASVATLTVFLGIWFIIMGAMEMIGSLVARRALHRERLAGVSVPAQRADQPAAQDIGQPGPAHGHASATTSRSDHRNSTS